MERPETTLPAPMHPLPSEGPIQPGSGRKKLDWRRILAPLGAIGLFLAKVGAKLKLLLLVLPKIKLFTTSATMLVSVGAYTLIWGWKFAVGFVLLPVVPLDGGRAMAALSPWMWLLGLAALAALTFAFPNPIMPLILLLGGLETWRRFQHRNSPEAQEYHRVSTMNRVLVAGVYIALIVLLAVGMSHTHIARTFGDA